MKWPKIITVGAVVIILFSGISIAGYGYLYSPAFKIEFPQNISFSFVDNSQLNAEYIIEREAPAPVSIKIEERARLRNIVGKCI